jgi:hypothetical protein
MIRLNVGYHRLRSDGKPHSGDGTIWRFDKSTLICETVLHRNLSSLQSLSSKQRIHIQTQFAWQGSLGHIPSFLCSSRHRNQ